MFVCFLTNVIMCRWLLFPNRCAMLPFSWAICGLFNRMINFWISVFPPLFAAPYYMTAPVHRLQHTGRCRSQSQLPVSKSEHWHCCVRFRPNGLHFLSLSLQWCWNQPLSRKVVGGWLVDCYWSGNKGKSDERASGFIVFSESSVVFLLLGVRMWCWEIKCIFTLSTSISVCFKGKKKSFKNILVGWPALSQIFSQFLSTVNIFFRCFKNSNC